MKPSKREQDMQRREGQTKWWPWAAAAIIAILVITVVATRQDVATDRASNIQGFGLADDPFMGDPDAPVVLVGYESPHCSACQHFHQTVLPQILGDIDNGSVVYYYIQGTIGQDMASSIAQECAYREGGNAAFWDITDRLYARGYTYTAPDWDAWLADLAARQGLDAEALKTCHESGETGSKVRADLRIGNEKGARGTPSFWIFGQAGEAKPILNYAQVPQAIAEHIADHRG